MTVETRTVWVEDLACCGDPFAVGSTVEWHVHSLDDADCRFLIAVFGEGTADRITDGYERHGQREATTRVVGSVRSIAATSWQVHPLADGSPETDTLGLYAIPGSVVIEARTSAHRFDRVGGRNCFGYIVDLDVANRAK